VCLCYPVWGLPAVFWQWLVQGDTCVESPTGTFQGTSSAACRRMLLADRNLQISGSVPGRTFPAKFRRSPVSDTQFYKIPFPIRAMNLWIMLRCETTYTTANRQNGTGWRSDLKQSWLILETMCSARRLATPLTSLVLETIQSKKPRCWFARWPCLRVDAQRIPFALIFVSSLRCCLQYCYLGVWFMSTYY